MTNDNINNTTTQTFQGISVHIWREAYHYDPFTGAIRWREDRPESHFKSLRGYRIWKTRSAGKVATSLSGDGYLQVGLTYQGDKQIIATAHRVAWLLYRGETPEDGLQFDHINGDKQDNRIENLRLVSNAENNRAFKRPQGGSSQYRGVAWYKRTDRWQANIRHKGIQRHLGCFDSEHAAALAFNIAAEALGWAEEAGNIIPAEHLSDAISSLRKTQNKLAQASREGWATKLTLRYQKFAQSAVVFTPKPEAIAEAA